MEPDTVQEILAKASKAVEDLPEHLQGRAFELAVGMLTEGLRQIPADYTRPADPVRRPSSMHGSDAPDVSDLLRACRRNPDRYLTFIQELETKGEDATPASIVDRFRTYRQDVPKLPGRDLGDMVANGLLEQSGKGRDATFVLKRKGRERISQLTAAVATE